MKTIRKLALAFTALFICNTSFAQEEQFQLSTHILDVSEGLPAENVTIKLEKMNAEEKTWDYISEKKTGKDGRIGDFLPMTHAEGNEGIYKLTFFTEPYFDSKNKESFYPFIEVTFQISGNHHFHVPITLSAFGYSTYRGS